jgi:hypothetical protein
VVEEIGRRSLLPNRFKKFSPDWGDVTNRPTLSKPTRFCSQTPISNFHSPYDQQEIQPGIFRNSGSSTSNTLAATQEYMLVFKKRDPEAP